MGSLFTHHAFDAKAFIHEIDAQAQHQNSQSSASILAEFSDLTSSKDQADAIERHREKDDLLARLGCNPWGSGDVRYGIDGISLHDDATKGASRAGYQSKSSARLRSSYEKKSKENMDLINNNYELTSQLDEKEQEVAKLKAALEELQQAQK